MIMFGASIFTGCDPGQTLVIKTSQNPKSSVEIYGSARMLPTERYDDTGKIILRMPSTDNNARRDTSFDYGIGTWGEGRNDKFVDNVDSIIINDSTGQLKLTGQTELDQYIKNHTSGYAGSIFTIEAK